MCGTTTSVPESNNDAQDGGGVVAESESVLEGHLKSSATETPTEVFLCIDDRVPREKLPDTLQGEYEREEISRRHGLS